MKSQRIYIDYEDYPVLEEEYTSSALLAGDVQTQLQTTNFSFLSSDTDVVNGLKAFVVSLIYPIYDEYHSDRMAYQSNPAFIYRLVTSLVRRVNRWYMQHKIDDDLLKNISLQNFIKNGGTHSETQENASTGSAVIQKSASTPTGISHDAQSESLDMDLSHDVEQDKTSMEVTDDYQDKYTNFVGKTNGLHRNEVDRDTDITRTSNYGMAMDILSKIPYSYINEVLAQVSQHFIQIY